MKICGQIYLVNSKILGKQLLPRFCRHWWYCITKNSDGYRKDCGLCARAPRSLIAIGSFTKNLLIKDLLSQGQKQRPQNFH